MSKIFLLFFSLSVFSGVSFGMDNGKKEEICPKGGIAKLSYLAEKLQKQGKGFSKCAKNIEKEIEEERRRKLESIYRFGWGFF